MAFSLPCVKHGLLAKCLTSYEAIKEVKYFLLFPFVKGPVGYHAVGFLCEISVQSQHTWKNNHQQTGKFCLKGQVSLQLLLLSFRAFWAHEWLVVIFCSCEHVLQFSTLLSTCWLSPVHHTDWQACSLVTHHWCPSCSLAGTSCIHHSWYYTPCIFQQYAIFHCDCSLLFWALAIHLCTWHYQRLAAL